MGLDQSIYTNSKTIAKAIYKGNIPNDTLWVDAFFSPLNIKKAEGWTDIDVYAKHRRAQFGWIDETDHARSMFSDPSIDVQMSDPNATGEDYNAALTSETLILMDASDKKINPAERKANLKMVQYLGTQGTFSLEGDGDFYQIGLFRKFNALHGWFNRAIEGFAENCPNDLQMVVDSGCLYGIMMDAIQVLKAFDVSKVLGKSFAKKLFPTCEGHFFGNTEYDDAFRIDLLKLATFVHTVLSFPEAEDAKFTYNPWW